MGSIEEKRKELRVKFGNVVDLIPDDVIDSVCYNNKGSFASADLRIDDREKNKVSRRMRLVALPGEGFNMIFIFDFVWMKDSEEAIFEAGWQIAAKGQDQIMFNIVEQK